MKQKIYIEISGNILRKKKSNTNKRLRWGYILGIKKLQNMIDNENANSIKTFKVICGDILTEKNNTNKILRWVHILGIKKKKLQNIIDDEDEKNKRFI